ncbi:MAG: hypothetical protein V7709_12020 [Halioglobus sp.]
MQPEEHPVPDSQERQLVASLSGVTGWSLHDACSAVELAARVIEDSVSEGVSSVTADSFMLRSFSHADAIVTTG